MRHVVLMPPLIVATLGVLLSLACSRPEPKGSGRVDLFIEESDRPSPVGPVLRHPKPPQARVTSHLDPSTVRSLVVEPAMRIDSGGTSAAAEVSVAASGDAVVAAWIDLRQGEDRSRIGVAISEDFGITWSDQLLQPPGSPVDDLHGDPMTAYDPVSGELWVGGLAFFDHSLFVSRHLTGSQDITTPVSFGHPAIVDKPWMAAGPLPGNPNAGRLYAIDAVGDVFLSDDLGLTWTAGGGTEAGIGHLPRVAPDGTLYVAYRGGNDLECRLQRSDDGGQTFTLLPSTGIAQNFFLDGFVPGLFRAPAFCVLAVDPNHGGLAMVFAAPIGSQQSNTDIAVLMTQSMDQGQSWTTPQIISGGPADSDQFLPWLEIGAYGRYHLIYLDTRRTGQDDTDPSAWLDVFYSTSQDQGASWLEVPLTETPFDSTSTAWLNDIEQFVGDYLGLAVSDQGVVVSYAATYGGDLDIYAQRLLFTESQLFQDGFESGNTSAWSAQTP